MVDKAVDMVYKVVVMVEVGQEPVHLLVLDHLQVVILDNKLDGSQIMDLMEVAIQAAVVHKLQKLLKL